MEGRAEGVLEVGALVAEGVRFEGALAVEPDWPLAEGVPAVLREDRPEIRSEGRRAAVGWATRPCGVAVRPIPGLGLARGVPGLRVDGCRAAPAVPLRPPLGWATPIRPALGSPLADGAIPALGLAVRVPALATARLGDSLKVVELYPPPGVATRTNPWAGTT